MDEICVINPEFNDRNKQFKCGDYFKNYDISRFIYVLVHSTEEFVRHVWLRGWQVVNRQNLPSWLKDNEFLLRYHRPQLNTFWACFKSIFRVHTETGNIWTHLLGCGCFWAITIYILTQSNEILNTQDKLIFSLFFISAIICFGISCLFHTLVCHSLTIGRLFNRLDYTGIAFLNIGSFIPYLYYSFYCILWARCVYICLIILLGTASVVVSMHPSFTSPRYRSLRAGVFMGLGLSGVIPCIHAVILNGLMHALVHGSLGWLILMALLYLSGATIYAVQIPERFFPGRFDVWFQSHQIFHVFSVAAALVHYHGLVSLADYYLTEGDCKPIGLDMDVGLFNKWISKVIF